MNGSKHCEYFNTVTLTKGQSFKVVYAGTYYGNYSIGDGVNETDFSGGGGNDITINTTGNYSLYFDATTKNVHIANPTYAEADEWAQSFMGANCAETKSNWSSSASSFASLSNGAKAYLEDATHIDHEEEAVGYINQAIQRYDYVLETYGVSLYSDFIGRASSGKVTPKASNRILSNSNSNILVIITISIVSSSTILGAFFLLKKKKHK